MTHETDPTKHLECYVSFDPAIDRAAMGKDFEAHFGATGERMSDVVYGSRDTRLLRFVPGKRASVFVLRPLHVYERAQCDSLQTAEARWLRAISYALVRAEVSPPLGWRTEAIFPRENADGRPMLDGDGVNYIAQIVGIHAIYEIGAVAYARSQIGPFVAVCAPLPAYSVHEQLVRSRSHADSHAASTFGTPTTDAGST